MIWMNKKKNSIKFRVTFLMSCRKALFPGGVNQINIHWCLRCDSSKAERSILYCLQSVDPRLRMMWGFYVTISRCDPFKAERSILYCLLSVNPRLRRYVTISTIVAMLNTCVIQNLGWILRVEATKYETQ
jgi:hypothetical protein